MKTHFEWKFNWCSLPKKLFHQQKEYWYNSTFQIDLRFEAFSIKTNNELIFEPNNVCMCAFKSNSEYFLHEFFQSQQTNNHQHEHKKHNCWFSDFTIFLWCSQFFPFFLQPLSLFFYFICKKPFGIWCTHVFQRKFETSVFRHSLAKNSSKHIQNVIHYTMNCYLELNLFSI